jgi:hypothetical protein
MRTHTHTHITSRAFTVLSEGRKKKQTEEEEEEEEEAGMGRWLF